VPGTLNREVWMALFEAIAEKCQTPADAIEVFTKLFPDEKWWWEDFLARYAASVSATATPAAATSGSGAGSPGLR
jgi:hypothetical protein